MPSRKIEDLMPELQEKFALFKEKMDTANISFVVTCTARSMDEQVALYAQGRQDLEEVNELRKKCDLYELTEKENRHKVTWTLNSMHIPVIDVMKESHGSRAFDIALKIGKKAHWDIKVDVNDNDIPDYEEAGKIGESVGLKWGGRFKSPDRPHFQLA